MKQKNKTVQPCRILRFIFRDRVKDLLARAIRRHVGCCVIGIRPRSMREIDKRQTNRACPTGDVAVMPFKWEEKHDAVFLEIPNGFIAAKFASRSDSNCLDDQSFRAIIPVRVQQSARLNAVPDIDRLFQTAEFLAANAGFCKIASEEERSFVVIPIRRLPIVESPSPNSSPVKTIASRFLSLPPRTIAP